MATNLVVNAYVQEYGRPPTTPSDLVQFTKQNTDMKLLKYSEARKLINNPNSKKGKKFKIAPKLLEHARARSARSVVNYDIAPKNGKKKNKKLSTSSTHMTPDKKRKKSRTNSKHSTQASVPNIKLKRQKSKKKVRAENEYKIGDIVKLTHDREGIIRYIGNVLFANGTWYGIELRDGCVGNHDGKVGQKRYFQSAKNRGVFVQINRINRKIRRRERMSSLQLDREMMLKMQEKRKSTNMKTIEEHYSIPQIPKLKINKISKKFVDEKDLDSLFRPNTSVKKFGDGEVGKPMHYSPMQLDNKSASFDLINPQHMALPVLPSLHKAVHSNPLPLHPSAFQSLLPNQNKLKTGSHSLEAHNKTLSKMDKKSTLDAAKEACSFHIVLRKKSRNLHEMFIAHSTKEDTNNNKNMKKHNNTKKRKRTVSSSNNNIKFQINPSHSKIHSPMIAVRLTPILTFDNVSAEVQKSLTSSMMMGGGGGKTRAGNNALTKAVIMANSPMISPAFTFDEDNHIHTHSADDSPIFRSKRTIGFSPRKDQSVTPTTPSMSFIPPLSKKTINYVEMEDKVEKLINILLKQKSQIKNYNKLYKKCGITKEDLTVRLPEWVDLLCTHPKLWEKTAMIKKISKKHSYFADMVDIMASPDSSKTPNVNGATGGVLCDDDDDDSDDDDEPTPSEAATPKTNDFMTKDGDDDGGNGGDDEKYTAVYHYTVFERLLCELKLDYLYLIYDIGIDNCCPLNELHPSSLFILSGNIKQVFGKCSPITKEQKKEFFKILNCYHMRVRYKYLNSKQWSMVKMVKYTDGIHSDYNFVGRIQYEEMYDTLFDKNDILNAEIDDDEDSDGGGSGSGSGGSDDDDDDGGFGGKARSLIKKLTVDGSEHNDLQYELIAYSNSDRAGMVIYKATIPDVFAVNEEYKIENLKRAIVSPHLRLTNGSKIKCEKWNAECDFYGFVRLKCRHSMYINDGALITASECGYAGAFGKGHGVFYNDTKNKCKYRSGGGYGTAAKDAHDECKGGNAYGDNVKDGEILYYGSPAGDENERGGGVIDIVCGQLFVNFGVIECNGSKGLQFGGGSGGSIRIVCHTFVNNGDITANGGKGGVYQRGGSKRKQIGTDGGDGRIVIICHKYQNNANISPEPTVIKLNNANVNVLKHYGFAKIEQIENIEDQMD